VVYVPTYNPTVVYGTWPYPANPPVLSAASSGLRDRPRVRERVAFMPRRRGGIAVGLGDAALGCCGGLWIGGRYGYGSVNVNVNHYNNISRNTINRAPLSGQHVAPRLAGVAGRPVRPPGGPVGAPNRGNGLPANAVGRPSVKVPAAR